MWEIILITYSTLHHECRVESEMRLSIRSACGSRFCLGEGLTLVLYLGAVLRGEAIPYSIVSVKKRGLRATYPLENPGSASAYMMLIRYVYVIMIIAQCVGGSKKLAAQKLYYWAIF